MFKKFLLLCIITTSCTMANAQVLTSEDSLANGFINKNSSIISGYGEAMYSYDVQHKNGSGTLKRNVLFVGHRFSNKISLFTELELEDAVASEGKRSISMEQAFLKLDLKPNTYFVAGLFIPRIGITNENHLSTTFNSVERPFVEQLIIPTTWREIGVGFYTQPDAIPGLYLSASLQNGLNAEQFGQGKAIQDGRFKGSKSNGLNIGSNLAVLYYVNKWRLQTSIYYGGSTPVEQRIADSIGLPSGAFANPVLLTEANVQYLGDRFNFKALAVFATIRNAGLLNTTYANNTPSAFGGGYSEVSYRISGSAFKKNWSLFTRYEYANTNITTPTNGIKDESKIQHYFIAGFIYKPVFGIAIKGNYIHRSTGNQNPALLFTPFPEYVPYFRNNDFVQLGIAYNF